VRLNGVELEMDRQQIGDGVEQFHRVAIELRLIVVGRRFADAGRPPVSQHRPHDVAPTLHLPVPCSPFSRRLPPYHERKFLQTSLTA